MSTQATARQKETEAEERHEQDRASRPEVNQRSEPYVPLTAKMVCTEITHTERGVTVLTLNARYDSNTRKENSLIKGSIPKGECTIEVENDWAAKNVQHGTVFMLTSSNQK